MLCLSNLNLSDDVNHVNVTNMQKHKSSGKGANG